VQDLKNFLTRGAVILLIAQEVCRGRHGGLAATGRFQIPEELACSEISRLKVSRLGFQGMGEDALVSLAVMGVTSEGLLAALSLGIRS